MLPTDFAVRTCSAPRQPGTLSAIPLAETEVDVWIARVVDSEPTDAWEGLLTPEERDRAQRFRFEEDFRRFVYGRGLLRELLASYLEARASKVQFVYSAEGKPGLAPEIATRPISFNVSHSGTYILVALAWNRRIGVDVERMRQDIDTKQIAKRFFSQAEQQALGVLDPDERIPAFFRCWTRKEAYVKATGVGLSLPLHQFDVSLLPGESATLLATRPEAREAQRWTLRNIELEAGYAAAVAVERHSATE
jgi:4'-phosphopantetheinyl transferase